MRVLALFAFSCKWVKLTNANLFISRGELNIRDHSNTPFLRSIMSFSVLCASSKFLLLASRVVLSTKLTICSFGSSFVVTRMRGALYIVYSSIDRGQPWQHPFMGENGVEVWSSNLSWICHCVSIMSMKSQYSFTRFHALIFSMSLSFRKFGSAAWISRSNAETTCPLRHVFFVNCST